MSIFNGSLKQHFESLKASFQPLGIDLGAISSEEDLKAELGKSFVAKADHDATATELTQTQEALKTANEKAAKTEAELNIANAKVGAYEKAFGAITPKPKADDDKPENNSETTSLEDQAAALKAKAAADEVARNASDLSPANLAPNGEDDDTPTTEAEYSKAYADEEDPIKKEAIYQEMRKKFKRSFN